MSVLKPLIPFWHLDIFERYIPQFQAIARHCKNFHVLYLDGEVDPDWPKCFTFHRVPTPRGIHRIHSMMRLKDTVPKRVKDIDFDLVYSLTGMWMQDAAYAIAKHHKLPLVLRLRGDTEESNKYQRKQIRTYLASAGIRNSFTYASAVIPIATHLKEGAARWGARNITDPIPNGVDTDKFSYTSPPETLSVGYVGRVSPEKGSSFLYEVINATPNVHFLLAGTVQCKWDPPVNAELIGHVPYRDIQRIYQACSIILLPSFTEGWPNVMLESYAAGRPILATPEAIPVEAELYGWARKMDVGSWAETINSLTLLELEGLGRKARKYAERFSWAEYGRRMAQILQSCTDGDHL